MEHTATPTAFYKARLTWNATRNGWDITRVDGLVYQFTAAGNIGAVAHHWNRLDEARGPVVLTAVLRVRTEQGQIRQSKAKCQRRADAAELLPVDQ